MSECQQRTPAGKPQKLSISDKSPSFREDGLPSKYHHSIENLILHITQVVSELTQVYERMSATNTSWKTPKTQYFAQNA